MHVRLAMAVRLQIAKFKLCQWRAILPNLMLAKVTCYTVHLKFSHKINVATSLPWIIMQLQIVLLFVLSCLHALGNFHTQYNNNIIL